MTSTSGSPMRAEVARTVPAPPEAVFRAWTDPALLQRWFWPWSPSAALDVRAGGAYEIAAQHPTIGELRVHGRYIEVAPSERLAFTWRWDGDPASEETIVTVTFRERDGATDVVVSHEGLRDAEDRAQNEQGWSDVLARLSGVLVDDPG